MTIKLKAIGWVGLRTAKVPEMVKFYEEIFGLDEADGSLHVEQLRAAPEFLSFVENRAASDGPVLVELPPPPWLAPPPEPRTPAPSATPAQAPTTQREANRKPPMARDPKKARVDWLLRSSSVGRKLYIHPIPGYRGLLTFRDADVRMPVR